MGTDKNLLSGVHELFPSAQEAYSLLKVYGEWLPTEEDAEGRWFKDRTLTSLIRRLCRVDVPPRR